MNLFKQPLGPQPAALPGLRGTPCCLQTAAPSPAQLYWSNTFPSSYKADGIPRPLRNPLS